MAKAVNIARSHRLDGIGEYYFSRRLREIAEIEAATGRQIVKLAMGSPDLPPHQSVIDRLAKEAQRPDVHKYMSYQGEPILRKAFADWYKKWYRTELDFKSEVLPLIGSKEGIMHICMTFLNKGDKVLVPNPGYPTYSVAVRLREGGGCLNSLRCDTGELDVEGVKMGFRVHQGGKLPGNHPVLYHRDANGTHAVVAAVGSFRVKDNVSGSHVTSPCSAPCQWKYTH